MSLKQLRKQATEGPRALCPACQQNIPVSELMSGRHAANDCMPFKAAIKDASIPKYQKQLQQQHDQAKLVTKHMTWSERHFELLGESNFIRQYWAPSLLLLTWLCWVIGYVTPQGSGSTYLWTLIIPPATTGTLIILIVTGRFHNPFKRRKRKDS